jgi:prepilin-type processing-associated H-X9-DG protein
VEFGPEHLGIAASLGAAAMVVASAWMHWRESRSTKVVAIVGSIILLGLAAVITFALQGLERSTDSFNKRNACIDNLMEIGKALTLYQSDNNDRAPLSDWTDSLSRYVDNEVFACPMLSPYGYTMNAAAVGLDNWKITSPARIVGLFDGLGGKNRVGGIDDIRWRHAGAAVIMYMDGHVKVWSPVTFEGMDTND